MNNCSFLFSLFLLSVLFLSAHTAEKRASPERKDDNDYLITLTGQNFKNKTLNGTWAVSFVLPGCKYCKSLYPTWKDLANHFNWRKTDERIVSIAKVDCSNSASKQICEEEGIPDLGYPTIRLYKFGRLLSFDYRGSRDYEDLRKWVEGGYYQKWLWILVILCIPFSILAVLFYFACFSPSSFDEEGVEDESQETEDESNEDTTQKVETTKASAPTPSPKAPSAAPKVPSAAPKASTNRKKNQNAEQVIPDPEPQPEPEPEPKAESKPKRKPKIKPKGKSRTKSSF